MDNGQVCVKSERGLICTMEAGYDQTRTQDAEQIVRDHNDAQGLREALGKIGAMYETAMNSDGEIFVYEEDVLNIVKAALRGSHKEE